MLPLRHLPADRHPAQGSGQLPGPSGHRPGATPGRAHTQLSGFAGGHCGSLRAPPPGLGTHKWGGGRGFGSPEAQTTGGRRTAGTESGGRGLPRLQASKRQSPKRPVVGCFRDTEAQRAHSLPGRLFQGPAGVRPRTWPERWVFPPSSQQVSGLVHGQPTGYSGKQAIMGPSALGPAGPVTRVGLRPQTPPPPGGGVSDTVGTQAKMTSGWKRWGWGGQEQWGWTLHWPRPDASAQAERRGAPQELGRRKHLERTLSPAVHRVAEDTRGPCKAPANPAWAIFPPTPAVSTHGRGTESGKGAWGENQRELELGKALKEAAQEQKVD